MTATAAPPVTWAQRKDVIFLNFDLNELSDDVLDIEPNKIVFHAKGQGNSTDYALDVELYDSVDPEGTTKTHTGRWLHVVLVKSNPGPFWPRLLKNKAKAHWLKVDFNKWQDEEESDEEEGPTNPGGQGLESLQQMLGNMNKGGGDLGSMDFSGMMQQGAESLSAKDDEHSDDEDTASPIDNNNVTADVTKSAETATPNSTPAEL